MRSPGTGSPCPAVRLPPGVLEGRTWHCLPWRKSSERAASCVAVIRLPDTAKQTPFLASGPALLSFPTCIHQTPYGDGLRQGSVVQRGIYHVKQVGYTGLQVCAPAVFTRGPFSRKSSTEL